MISQASEIKHIESNVQAQNTIEVDLSYILIETFQQELPSDINNMW